jgi:hypothetical protein
MAVFLECRSRYTPQFYLKASHFIRIFPWKDRVESGSMAYLQKKTLKEMQYVRRPDKILTLYCSV